MKEDDMDETLRKAAENYEVDAGKAADWNFVYTAVHNKPEQAVAEKRKRRFAFWWLFLIPLGWIANTEYNKFHADNKKNTPVISPDKKSNNSQSSEQQKQVSPSNNTIKLTGAAKKHTDVFKTRNKHLISTYNKPITGNDYTINSNVTGIQQQQDVSTSNLQKQNSSGNPVDEINNDKQIQTQAPVINLQNKNAAAVNDLTPINSNINKQQNKNATAAVSSIKKQQVKQHYFYTGLLAGGDLSFVRYQKIQSAGYNLGVIAGYTFNKFSIETGIFTDKKNYYTNGEYFDKTSIPFFNNAKVLSVKGYCRMYEIPLNVKYNLSEKKKHTWFASAGLSSYLMNKEFYHYAYKEDGVNHYGSYPYFHTTKNWFSVINLSAGYELRTGIKSSLHIAPYYKTTLTGVGTGKLSITSIGINAGITRRIP